MVWMANPNDPVINRVYLNVTCHAKQVTHGGAVFRNRFEPRVRAGSWVMAISVMKLGYLPVEP